MKEKIAVLIDSCTDVPEEYVERYHMFKVPIIIRYADGEYIDGVDITSEEVCLRLEREVPATSLPSPETIQHTFERIKSEGYRRVIVVTISAGLSGTHNLIRLMARDFNGLEFYMLNTKNIGIGSGLSAILAARLIEQGLDFEEITRILEESVTKNRVFFCVSTLEYLRKGGRIGLVAAVVGSVLNLKPIISCNEEGVYHSVAKTRGRRQSLERAVELASDFARGAAKYNLAIAHVRADEEAGRVREMMLSLRPNAELILDGGISPALTVHTGPGLVGIGVQLL